VRFAGVAAAVLALPLLVVVLVLTAVGGAATAPAATAADVTSVQGLPKVVAPSQAVASAIAYAEKQLGCPYVFGGTGPCQDGFDCSGLVMMAYRAAGVDIARTSEEQWATEMRVPASQVQPGDLIFFAGSDGTLTAPGHVGLVIGKGEFIEAYATGFPVRISTYDVSAASLDANYGGLVGFTRPWA
jgi:cell wall-associated NlpC family hydrolase